MNESQLLTSLKNLLIAATWTGGSNVVFPTGSVIITPNLEEGLKAALNQAGLRTPMCLMAPEAAESDPQYDEEPDLQKYTFTVLICVTIPGGAIGQETLMSANVPDSTKSEGQGILAIENELFDAIGKLNALENVVIQNIQRSEQGGAFHPPGTYISYRTYRLEAWGTTGGNATSSTYSSVSSAISSATQTATDTSLANITGLSFAVTAGTAYYFQFMILHQSDTATIGLRLALTFPAATVFAATARFPESAGATTTSERQAVMTTSGTSVTGAQVPAITTTYVASIEGVITPSATGTLQVQFAAETTGGTVTVYPSSSGLLYATS